MGAQAYKHRTRRRLKLTTGPHVVFVKLQSFIHVGTVKHEQIGTTARNKRKVRIMNYET